MRATVFTRWAILLVTLVVTLAGTCLIIHLNAYFDPYQEEVAQVIREHTAPKDKMVVWGMNWGDPFLRANREGLTGGLALDDSHWFNDPQTIGRLKKLGYNKIVLINPSPFIAALTTVNSKHGEKIVNLHEHLPNAAKNWPVVLDTTQILIVQIPD